MPVTGERLIESHKGMLAVALLNRGLSCAKAAAIAGISKNGALALRHWGRRHKTRLQAIESIFRDKSKVIADLALTAIDQKKLKRSSALECARVARLTGEMAGLVTVSPTPSGNQLNVLQQFFGLQSGLRSISAVDVLPNSEIERKNEQDLSKE